MRHKTALAVEQARGLLLARRGGGKERRLDVKGLEEYWKETVALEPLLGLWQHGCGGQSRSTGSHFGGPGEFTTHFRTYFGGDWDVHWGCGSLTHGHIGNRGLRSA